MMQRRFVTTMMITMLASACAPNGSAPGHGTQDGFAELKFITFGPGVTGLTQQVKKPTMTACLYGVSTAEKSEWEDKIKRSMLKWVDTVRDLSADELTNDVKVVLDSGDCDVDVTVQEGVHANTIIGQSPRVNMGASGYMASFNTMLHEFGHAFALSDTYQNGVSGNCQPGQPQAVMCNTSFDTPQSDDVKGMADVFKSAFPSDRPDGSSKAYKFSAALGAEQVDTTELRIGLSGAPEKTGANVEVCDGSLEDCKGDVAVWKTARRSGPKGDAVIFSLRLALKEGMQLTVRYGKAYQAFEIKQPT